MANLGELQRIIATFCHERDWKQFHDPKDLAISLSLEAAEVLEHFQWKNSEEQATHIQERKEEIGEELADVLYWLLLMSSDFDIDLEQAFLRKMDKNALKYPVQKAKGSHAKYTEL